MYSQLDHTIAQQHHAELIQAAQRAQVIRDAKRDAGRQSTSVLDRIRRRIASPGAPVTPRAKSKVA